MGKWVELNCPCCARGNTDAYGEEHPEPSICASESPRNLISFFCFGLINNFAYVVFQAGAVDLLPENYPVATVLLSQMLPSLAFQGLAPFLHVEKIPYWIRILFIFLTTLGPFFLVAYVDNIPLRLTGIAISAASCGFGEITFFSLSSFYHNSGTGGAGIAGSLLYIILAKWLDICPSATMQLVAPFTLLIPACYFFVLTDHKKKLKEEDEKASLPTDFSGEEVGIINETRARLLTFKEKVYLQKRLFKYTGPLFLVYFAEYFINNALAPILTFYNNSAFPPEAQYTYYYFLYQVGVFISRSSANLIKIRLLWLMSLLQCVNAAFLLCAAYWEFLPSIWIVFAFQLYQGLLGGGVFVNAFYVASEEIEDDIKEFCMSSISMCDEHIASACENWLKQVHPPPPAPPHPKAKQCYSFPGSNNTLNH